MINAFVYADCRVRVNRNRTPKEVIAATKRDIEKIDGGILMSMPGSIGDEEVMIYFFIIDRYIIGSDIAKAYESQDLKPVDPYALASVNETNPAFADTHPHSTHWGNGDYLAFYRWTIDEHYPLNHPTGRGVIVGNKNDKRLWPIGWSFAGVKK